jgi:predicted hydrocarbon binding protein
MVLSSSLGDPMVALPRAALAALRTALVANGGPYAATALQEAGYAGGEALFAAFSAWLRERESADVGALPVVRFADRAGEYFRACGWGSLAVGTLGDALVTLDSDDWWEDDPAADTGAPGSPLSIGLFASFFSQLAGEQLAVLQVESRAAGGHRARFLIGGADVMDHVYDQLRQGAPYEDAIAGVA